MQRKEITTTNKLNEITFCGLVTTFFNSNQQWLDFGKLSLHVVTAGARLLYLIKKEAADATS